MHIVFVPCLVWSALVFMTYTGPLATLPLLSELVPVNAGFVVALMYMLYYLYLDFWAAVRCDRRAGPRGLGPHARPAFGRSAWM